MVRKMHAQSLVAGPAAFAGSTPRLPQGPSPGISGTVDGLAPRHAAAKVMWAMWAMWVMWAMWAMRCDGISPAPDPEVVDAVMPVEQCLADERMTLQSVTHPPHFARKVADRGHFTHAGRVRKMARRPRCWRSPDGGIDAVLVGAALTGAAPARAVIQATGPSGHNQP